MRGFSTIMAGGLIILIFSLLATVYLINLDANQYRFIQTGEYISKTLSREAEDLKIYMDGGVIKIKNVGSTPVNIKYIVEKIGGSINIQEVDLNIEIGDELDIAPFGSDPNSLLLISSKGKVYTVDTLDILSPTGNSLFEWVNSSYLTLNIPINISSSLSKLENSILIIYSQDYGYLVVDLYRGDVIYQGRDLIIPSRDGAILYVDGVVYLNGRQVIYGYTSLKYVGYNYLVVSTTDYVHVIVSDGSIYTYRSDGLKSGVIYNGENLVIIGYEGESTEYYRYYKVVIKPLNYSIVDFIYIELPIKPSDIKPNYVSIPGSSWVYTFSSSNTSEFIGIFRYRLSVDNYIHNVFSTPLIPSSSIYRWSFKYWYFNVDGGIKHSDIDYIQSLSTLDSGIPMDWNVSVSSRETPFYDEDLRIYNLTSYRGYLSILSKITYGYSGLTQLGTHQYRYILGGNVDYIEININISLVSGSHTLNISIYRLYPDKILVDSFAGSLRIPIVSLDLYIGDDRGRGVIHLYDSRRAPPYIESMAFDIPKNRDKLLLKIVNSTNVSYTSGYQYSEMSFKVFIFDEASYFMNIYTPDYLVDGKIDRHGIYFTSRYVVVDGSDNIFSYVNDSLSIDLYYGYSMYRLTKYYYISFPTMVFQPLDFIDSVGLYILNGDGVQRYIVDIGWRYDWRVYTYNNLYLVAINRFGGVDIYVYKY